MIVDIKNMNDLTSPEYMGDFGVISAQSGDVYGMETIATGVYEETVYERTASMQTVDVCGTSIYESVVWVRFSKKVKLSFEEGVEYALISSNVNGSIIDYGTSGKYNYVAVRVFSILGDIKAKQVVDFYDTTHSFKIVKIGVLIRSLAIASVSSAIKTSTYGVFDTPYAFEKTSSIVFNDLNYVSSKEVAEIYNNIVNGFLLKIVKGARTITYGGVKLSELGINNDFSNTINSSQADYIFKDVFQLSPKEKTITTKSGRFIFNFNGTII
jgi:hypothetical protein